MDVRSLHGDRGLSLKSYVYWGGHAKHSDACQTGLATIPHQRLIDSMACVAGCHCLMLGDACAGSGRTTGQRSWRRAFLLSAAARGWPGTPPAAEKAPGLPLPTLRALTRETCPRMTAAAMTALASMTSQVCNLIHRHMQRTYKGTADLGQAAVRHTPWGHTLCA